jgi:DNA modification methylase
MRWLVRLVTPPGGLVLDPFLGSGTTAVAAELEGLRWLGIERDPGYARIAEGRIAFWQEYGEEGLEVVARREAADRVRERVAEAGQLDLF